MSARSRDVGAGHRDMRHTRLISMAAAMMVAVGLHLPARAVFAAETSASAEAFVPSDEEVQLAIDRAIKYIWLRRRGDGRWVSKQYEKAFPYGLTALCTFTLRSAGVPMSHRRLSASVNKLAVQEELSTVYARSFALLTWCRWDPLKNQRRIEEDVRLLRLEQKDGGFGYGRLSGILPDRPWRDNSNTQLALLALAEAQACGFEVLPIVWREAERSWLTSQNADGGWGYPLVDDPAFAGAPHESYGSMTAAGLASLYLIHDGIYLNAASRFNGRFKAKCGEDLEKSRALREAVDQGWAWLDSRFRVDAIPELTAWEAGDFRQEYLTYYLYTIDRLGVLSGRKYIGGRPWYQDVAAQLVRTQAPNGSWGGVHETCFGILALLKGRHAILINKLRYPTWADHELSETDPRDAANLVRWFARRFEEPVTWQYVDINREADLYDAPVLYITGHELPEFDEAQRGYLRDYVHRGGTILAVACCGKQTFVDDCCALFGDILPHLKQETIDPQHPIWTVLDEVPPSDKLIGFSDGCRTRIFLWKEPACCAWQQNMVREHPLSFNLASNILIYSAFGWGEKSRLKPFFDHGTSPGTTANIRVAQIRHDGDWSPDSFALTRLSNRLAAATAVGLDVQPSIRADRARLAHVDALYVTGHDLGALRQAGLAELRAYIEGGGTLIATACCGREAFDTAFRPFIEKLLRPRKLEMIPPQDPLMTGKFAPLLASEIGDVWLRPRLGGHAPVHMDNPELYGIKVGDRWGVIYAPHDLNCGMAGHACPTCIGYQPRYAEIIGGNLFLYAWIHGQEGGD